MAAGAWRASLVLLLWSALLGFPAARATSQDSSSSSDPSCATLQVRAARAF